jgi:hypothetical protein
VRRYDFVAGSGGEYFGKIPLTLKIYGDKDGTFHNFGSQEYVVQVLA